MKNLKPFQFIIIIGSIALALIGLFVFAFAGSKPGDNVAIGPTVQVWGILPASSFSDTLRPLLVENSKLAQSSQLPLNVNYSEKSEETFRTELFEAIANGTAPDVVILPVSALVEIKKLLYTIPFANYPERTFKDTFIDEGDLFRQSNGYLALPFAVDPLVMYYNKTIFTQANIITPPRFWDEIISLAPKLTTIDSDLKISRSAIALGEYRNIRNSKEILSNLFLQAGTPITEWAINLNGDNIVKSNLYDPNHTSAVSIPPAVAALDFYTQFADPSKSSTYTWNRALPNSLDMFLGGNLAIYLGFGSEAGNIEEKNPNLNFDMSFMPQERSSGLKSTYGNLYGIAILKQTKNTRGSYQALTSLTSNKFLKAFAFYSDLPPVRRDLLVKVPTDPFSPILYESAFKAKGWLDPNADNTNAIFKDMVESVLSGRELAGNAALHATLEIEVVTEKLK